MSIVKISQLPSITSLNANTANTLFVAVDLPSAGTRKVTAKVLAKGLYLNETLDVGNNPNTLPNTVAQFALGGASYIQTNLVNTDDGGSADIVVTANAGSGGTDSAYFIDMGFANKSYQPGSEFNNIGTSIRPLDGYLYVQGLNSSSNGGNLIIGATTSNGQVKVIAGGGSATNIVATFTNTGLTLNTQSYLTFADGTKQTTNSATYAFSQSLQTQTNTNTANITYIFGVNNTQNTNTQASFDKANNAIANTNGVTTAGNFNISGNLNVTGSVTPQKGFIWIPRNTTLNTPTVAIDFANDSVIRVNTNVNLAASLSSFVAGKVVEMWVTNMAAGNSTFTHGCSALNSTVNAIDYAVPSTSSVFVRYLSFGTDLANTFVSITHT